MLVDINGILMGYSWILMGCEWDIASGVIKHGLLENLPFIDVFPSKLNISFGDFLLPCLISRGYPLVN